MTSAPTRFHASTQARKFAGAAGRALADLAFGSLSRRQGSRTMEDAPLAILRPDTLLLDLSDPAQRAFGDYELLERIGEGGMGVVYRARQKSLDREVAVKLLAAGPWASREFIERFLVEARHAARMQHPNIVTVYEVGTTEELHYFTMRLVQGTSLAHTIAVSGPLESRRAASLAHTIAEAVAYAHSLGVLHLDLKPANVLLDANDIPHVADFGLARRFDPLLAESNTEISGTPSYMAPEQAAIGAHPLTPSTDIWGLGAILYELVTGEPPFHAADALSTLSLVRESKPRPPRSFHRQLPRDLEAIILRCLQKEPSARYPSVRALADDLERFIEGRPVAARPLDSLQRIGRWAKREPRLAATAALAFALLVAGLIATTQQWRRADSNAARAAAAAKRAESSAADASNQLWAGRRDMARRLMQEGKGFAALAPLIDNIAEQEHAGLDEAHSIERRDVGMILAQGVRLIDRMILPDAAPLASALDPDGRLLAIALSDFSVRWYDTATLTERGRIDVSDLPTSDGKARLPRALRFIDDRRLIVTLDWFDYLASPSHNDSILVDLDDARPVALPAGFKDPAEAVFSADGAYALLRDRRDTVQLWRVDPWRPMAPPVHLRHTNIWQALLGRSAKFIAEKREDVDGYLTLRDPRGAGPARKVGLRAALTAWAESRDGKLLAIGDARGNLYLLDVAAFELRQLPTPAGREITWVAFSEDDAWIAAVRWDGEAFAFDVASGDPLNSGQMQNDFEPHEVAINHHERLLVAAGLGRAALWRLPDPGPNALGATRVVSAPAGSDRAGTNSLAINLPQRLLASADMNGEVRLWRVPAPPSLAAFGNELGGIPLDNARFDGKHVPDVAWNRLRIVDIDGKPATPWAAVPQPPGFVTLVDGGRTLVAASGPALHVLEGDPLAQRIPPVALPANPLYAAIDSGGKRATLGFGHNGADGFEVDIVAIDLATGIRRAQARMPGPLHRLELSPDDKRLLAIGPVDGATDVFDSATLRRIGSYPHDALRPVTSATFIPDSDALWLLTRDADDGTANDADLLQWHPGTGEVSQRRHIADVFPVGVTMLNGKPLLASRDRDILDPGTPSAIVSVPSEHGEASTVFAQSHDGRLLAQVIGRDVQLYDAATLEQIGPPLRSNRGTYSSPYQLAFSPDDSVLLGGPRPWLTWPVATETRPLSQLQEVARLLVPGEARNVLSLPSNAERARLHATDPGPPPPAEVRPTFASARTVRGLRIPARDPTATPLQLDLTSRYNRAADQLKDMTSSVIAGYAGLRAGLARLDGVDYDLRGAIELRRQGSASHDRVTGIRVPDRDIAAFHVLLIAPLVSPTERGRVYAIVRLHYADGGSAPLPLRTGIEIPGMPGNERTTPVGWVRSDFLRQIGLTHLQYFSNPRLPNPYPSRRVVSLDLEATRDEFSSPVFFAITVEPVIPLARSGTDVTGDPAAVRDLGSARPENRDAKPNS